MKRLLILVLAGTAAPALAQHGAHSAPATQAAPAPNTCTPEHAAMGHCQLPSPAPPSARPPATSDPHAGHAPATPPTVGPSDPYAGHSLDRQPSPAAGDPHAGHGTGAHGAGAAPPAAPPPAGALSGPEHAADLFFDPAAMAQARADLRKEHGGLKTAMALVDQAELKLRDGREGYGWDAQAWYGGDINKLWIKTEGEGTFHESVETAEIQALWSRAIDPWFDLQLGVRYDLRPDPERAYLVAGVQGLAPYWFELDGSVFVSTKGDLSAKFEAEYDLRITQRLILQPRLEFDLAAQDVPELRIGSGLSEAAIEARLRYEINPDAGPASIAPYLGVEYARAFGDSAKFRRAANEQVGGWNLLVGVRTWF